MLTAVIAAVVAFLVTDSPAAPRSAVDELRAFVAQHALDEVAAQPFAAVAISKKDADEAREILWAAHTKQIRVERSKEIESRVLVHDGARMPFWFTTFGEKPPTGRSLYISMHGGGGAPKQVNDQQWENQKHLYTLDEGIYLAPRAPSDEWNLWHQPPIDALFDRLIEDLIVLEDVNPDRVYIMGYSAGGDGVYQLAPRMADRLASAAMMAGHPNETKPDGLRNIGFALHVGANDSAYDRNKIAAQWKEMLEKLAADNPGAYRNQVELHEGKGHWMGRDDAKALPWMGTFTRDARPTKIVWLQDDVTHRRFYWLAVDEPRAGARVVAEREGQIVRVVEATNIDSLCVRLDDEMVDLDRDVVVLQGVQERFHGRVPRTIATLARTLTERGDPRGVFSAEVAVTTKPSQPTVQAKPANPPISAH
ncbi:MAG: alpha/beta hydrolase [Phycisphaerae bacterium]|nr:alpha/beta hydrolase [Phycisphaerae bacterium]